MLDDLLDITDPTRPMARLADERAPDIVEALDEATPERAAALLMLLPPDRAIDVIDQLGLEEPAEAIAAMPSDRAVALLDGVSADRLDDIFRVLEEPTRSNLLGKLDADASTALRALLAYPEESAGSIMTTEFVSVPATWSAAQVLDHVRKVESTRETIYSIFVVDPVSKKLLSVLPLRRLISANPQTNVLAAVRQRRLISLCPLASRDEATRLIAKYDLLAIPVIDAAGHVIGIVTVDDVIDAITQKSTDEVQRFGGVEALRELYLRIDSWR